MSPRHTPCPPLKALQTLSHSLDPPPLPGTCPSFPPPAFPLAPPPARFSHPPHPGGMQVEKRKLSIAMAELQGEQLAEVLQVCVST